MQQNCQITRCARQHTMDSVLKSAYQEWGKILANRIDTNFSRSVGEDGACKPDFPQKNQTPRPVEEHSSFPDGKRKRHWKTYWVLQNLGFKSKSLSLRRVLPWEAHVGGGPLSSAGYTYRGTWLQAHPLCHLQGTTLARPMGSPRSEKDLLLGRGPPRAAISGPSPLRYQPEYTITVNSTQWVFCSLPPPPPPPPPSKLLRPTKIEVQNTPSKKKTHRY